MATPTFPQLTFVALLGSMALLVPHARAAVGTGNPFAALKPLPKTHHSWPVPANVLDPTDDLWPALLSYVAITHSCPISASWATQAEVNGCVTACKFAADSGSTANMAVNYSPWESLPAGVPPTYNGPEVQTELSSYTAHLQTVASWIAQANAHDGASVVVEAILLDSERWETRPGNSTWNDALTAKHAAIYNVSKTVFPNAVVEWYARGGFDRSASDTGWSQTRLFTLDGPGDTFGVSLYSVGEIGYTRLAYNKTVNSALAHGVTEVTPWIALGCGYEPTFDDVTWSFTWDYNYIYSWQLGAQINVDWFGERPTRFARWTAAKRAIFYPSIFDVRTDQVGNSTAIMEHFVAYVNGAHLNRSVPAVTNCSAN